jgi:hypothetical protein
MPYISQELRKDVDDRIDALNNIVQYYDEEVIDGVMNYIITRLMRANYNLGHYWQYNSAIGVLECAKLELYRRVIGPYEDIKIIENGDV